jgi:membrane protein DedA with SNARE-associated domain
MNEWLSQYGYLAVFAGCLLEGETVLVLAGLAVHQGYLSFGTVVAAAFLGGTLGDQCFFLLGKWYGTPLLTRFPSLAARTEPVHELIRRHQAAIIVAVRFMYGLRIAGPVAIGMSAVPVWRFALLNPVGAALWACIITAGGYFFGQTMQWLLKDLGHYEELAAAAVVLVVAALALLRRMRRRRKQRR